MATTTKLSITVPTRVLRAAERTLAQPGETRSALLSRVLEAAVAQALEDQYAAGYREQPVSEEEDAILLAAAREGFAHVAAEERAAGVDAPR